MGLCFSAPSRMCRCAADGRLGHSEDGVRQELDGRIGAVFHVFLVEALVYESLHARSLVLPLHY